MAPPPDAHPVRDAYHYQSPALDLATLVPPTASMFDHIVGDRERFAALLDCPQDDMLRGMAHSAGMNLAGQTCERFQEYVRDCGTDALVARLGNPFKAAYAALKVRILDGLFAGVRNHVASFGVSCESNGAADSGSGVLQTPVLWSFNAADIQAIFMRLSKALTETAPEPSDLSPLVADLNTLSQMIDLTRFFAFHLPGPALHAMKQPLVIPGRAEIQRRVELWVTFFMLSCRPTAVFSNLVAINHDHLSPADRPGMGRRLLLIQLEYFLRQPFKMIVGSRESVAGSLSAAGHPDNGRAAAPADSFPVQDLGGIELGEIEGVLAGLADDSGS